MRQQSVVEDRGLAIGVLVAGVAWMVPCAGAAVAAAATGAGPPSFTADAPITLLTHPSTPALAFGPSVGPAWWYWVTTATVTAILLIPLLVLWRRRSASQVTLVGCASRADVAAASGRRALLRRASVLRPSLTAVRPQDVGYRLGSSRGVESYASVEDSMVVLGPPSARARGSTS